MDNASQVPWLGSGLTETEPQNQTPAPANNISINPLNTVVGSILVGENAPVAVAETHGVIPLTQGDGDAVVSEASIVQPVSSVGSINAGLLAPVEATTPYEADVTKIKNGILSDIGSCIARLSNPESYDSDDKRFAVSPDLFSMMKDSSEEFRKYQDAMTQLGGKNNPSGYQSLPAESLSEIQVDDINRLPDDRKFVSTTTPIGDKKWTNEIDGKIWRLGFETTISWLPDEDQEAFGRLKAAVNAKVPAAKHNKDSRTGVIQPAVSYKGMGLSDALTQDPSISSKVDEILVKSRPQTQMHLVLYSPVVTRR